MTKEIAKAFKVDPATIWRWKKNGAPYHAKLAAIILYAERKLKSIPGFLQRGKNDV